jgi:hypothetical protein
MEENRRKYTLDKAIKVNDISISEVIIDPHVDKHKDHVNDDLILSLVTLLDGKTYQSKSSQDGFSYFASMLKFNNNIYRLVWLLEDHSFYIGVITTFKDKGGRK